MLQNPLYPSLMYHLIYPAKDFYLNMIQRIAVQLHGFTLKSSFVTQVPSVERNWTWKLGELMRVKV